MGSRTDIWVLLFLTTLVACGGKVDWASKPEKQQTLVITLSVPDPIKVIGSADMPYWNKLAIRYGFKQFFVQTGSETQSLALELGPTFNIANPTSWPRGYPDERIAQELTKSGTDWRIYVQNLPKLFPRQDVDWYKAHCIPDFRSLNPTAALVPLSQLSADIRNGSLPNYSFIFPDDRGCACQDGRKDCFSVINGRAAADYFLETVFELVEPNISAKDSVMITFDSPNHSSEAEIRTIPVIITGAAFNSGKCGDPCIFNNIQQAKTGRPGIDTTRELLSLSNSNNEVLRDQKIMSSPNSHSDSGSLPVGVSTDLTVGSIRNIRYADQFNPEDIFAGVNAAFVHCGNSCLVAIPSGTYKTSTTLNYPATTNGTLGLWIQEGAVINYTGQAYAIFVDGRGTSSLNLNIFGKGKIIGTEVGLAGIFLSRFSRGKIEGITVEDFTNGAGILNMGANTLEISDVQLSSNKYGFRNVGSGDGYGPNGISMHDSLINRNTTWGIFEDASGMVGGTGLALGNSYTHVILESNGTDAHPATGNMYIQGANTITIQRCFFEYFTGESKHQNLLIGDSEAQIQSTNVRVIANSFLSPGTASTIISYAYGLRLEDNTELAENENFLEHLRIAAGPDGTLITRNFPKSKNQIAGNGLDSVQVFNDRATVPENAAKVRMSAAPTCNASNRGSVWYQPGDAGIKDDVKACAKDSSDVYAWRALF